MGELAFRKLPLTVGAIGVALIGVCCTDFLYSHFASFLAVVDESTLRISMTALGPPARFSFAYFEATNRPNDAMVAKAEDYLNQKYPPGSNALVAVDEMTHAGAKCGHVDDGREVYLCVYDIPWVFDMRWHIGFYVEPGTHKVTKIGLSRGVIAS